MKGDFKTMARLKNIVRVAPTIPGMLASRSLKDGKTSRSPDRRRYVGFSISSRSVALLCLASGFAVQIGAPAFGKSAEFGGRRERVAAHPVAEVEALDLAKHAISLRSVRGPGNQTPEVAALFKQALLSGGFAPSEVAITPVDDTAYLIARWPGTDLNLKPLVISGHMDVVEANPADWHRDPFTPIVENGFLYGRGASDMKLDAALVIASLGELRRSGYRPRRTIIIGFSGDEETSMKTSAIIAQELRESYMVLNVDGGGGRLDESTGKPRLFSWVGAEKIYADYRLTVTNPGGHSSQPRKDNAIGSLAAALVRIGEYRFKPELNGLTRGWFVKAAQFEDSNLAAAMRSFATNPADEKAVATLSAKPSIVGKLGTTCVVTMIEGGHAPNALPQRASANINCRIFPGHTPEEIMAALEKVASDPSVKFEHIPEGTVVADASPMRADFISAVESAMHKAYPGVPVIPSMAAGASDSAFFRRLGIPSYTASPIFMKPSDDFSHGLNERVPISNIRPAIIYYISLMPMLSK